ncbi:helix-turn-helix domain-containing protein [Nocardia sp. NPDC127606]|uniref:helix-turn-helix domain-containing protein n=1 Tax=Nocardia sp. NPDC127606 TaxID=3345406 RepID=UPI00362EB6F0
MHAGRIQHLTMAEREEISRGPAMGCSTRTIATRIRGSHGRSPATVAAPPISPLRSVRRRSGEHGGRSSPVTKVWICGRLSPKSVAWL